MVGTAFFLLVAFLPSLQCRVIEPIVVRCDLLNESPGEEKSNLHSQWPVAGPAGALGAPLAPAQEPAGVGGEHTRGLDPAPTRGWILGIMFNHSCYLGQSIMGGIAPGLL